MKFLKYVLLSLCLAVSPVLVAAAQSKAPQSALAELQQHVVNGPWTSHLATPKGGAALYVLHSRSCPFCKAFFEQELDGLLAEGVDVRVIPVPTRDVSPNIIAQLAYQRDPNLLKRFNRYHYIAAPDSRASAELTDAFNQTVYASQIMSKTLQTAGYSGWTPGFLYQTKDGDWYIHAGYSREGFTRARTDLTARASSETAPFVPAPSPEAPAQVRPVIPGCPQLLAWGYSSSKQDENRRGYEYTLSPHPGRQAGTHRLWGLMPEQMQTVFGARLVDFSEADLKNLENSSLECLNILDQNRRAARAEWNRGGQRGDDTYLREMDDVFYRANMFFNLMLGMNRPVNDTHAYDAVMSHQRSLASE